MTINRGVRGNPKNVEVGQKFDRWTVLGPFTRKGSNNSAYFPCKCECGTERDVNYRTLREIAAGSVTGSCGCRHREVMSSRQKYGVPHGTPEWRRASWLWKNYKITVEEWNALFKGQQGKCAICLEDIDESGSTHVDHCHKTGKIRGLLCSGCNTGIGMLRENVNTLQRAISYLTEHGSD
jgi:hypothetical protein